MKNVDSNYKNSGIPSVPSKRVCPFDPPPEYKYLRTEYPISQVLTQRGDIVWLVTKFEDICNILVDKRFSSDPKAPGFPTYITGNVPPPPGFFLQADAPDHTRLRRAVTKEFLASHVNAMRPRMQEIFDTVLDKMLKLTPPVDFVKTLAIPVASQIICELLGVSLIDYPFVKNRTDIILDRSRSAKETEIAAIELMELFDRIVTAKEKTPSDDLLGRLILQVKNDGRLNHEELVGLAALLLLSAYDTMALAMGLGVVVLLQNPQQLADFLKDPSLGDNLVHELVRYLTINHSGLPRAAIEDIEINGTLIRAGEGVLLMINSGNRDECAFDKPDMFNIHRNEHSHLGFGHGVHKCLGMHFALAELQIAFRTLFTRVPSLNLTKNIYDSTGYFACTVLKINVL